MSLLAKRSLIKEDKSNIITLGAIAKEEKKKDPSVINSTIGMLFDEDGKLFTFKSVDRALNELTPDEKYAYASTPGSKEFHEAIKRWVFRQYYDEFTKNMYTAVMATPGGSGALSNTFTKLSYSSLNLTLPVARAELIPYLSNVVMMTLLSFPTNIWRLSTFSKALYRAALLL